MLSSGGWVVRAVVLQSSKTAILVVYIDRVRPKHLLKIQVNNTIHFYTVPYNNVGHE